MSDAAAELQSFFDQTELKLDVYERFADLVYANARSREKFEQLLNLRIDAGSVGPADALKIGVGQLMLNSFQDAIEWFEKAGDDAARHYYQARAELGLNRFEAAAESFENAAKAGWDRFDCDMQHAAVLVRMDDLDAAGKLVEKHQGIGQDRPDWYYVKGLISEKHKFRNEALNHFDKALQLNEEHEPTMFRAAYLYDLMGEDEHAIALYEQLALKPRAHVNALINLAVIYEDAGNFESALRCLRRVLAIFPNHPRARLFLKDVESSREMMIDDAAEQRSEKRDRMLETPINEFELSVRARNCLKKMNINVLGDLVKLREDELLSFKNFGETSLNEIKALLSKMGLRLGQQLDEIDLSQVETPEKEEPPPINVPPGKEDLLGKPVSEMELSVRARRCLQRLNIVNVGDLIRHTENELLSTRNFGVTSLNEIKEKLDEYGLALQGGPSA